MTPLRNARARGAFGTGWIFFKYGDLGEMLSESPRSQQTRDASAGDYGVRTIRLLGNHCGPWVAGAGQSLGLSDAVMVRAIRKI